MRIAPAALTEIAAHAAAESPRECCGLLVGTEGSVDESVRTRNLEPGITRFTVDPAEHLALIKRLRSSGRDVVGAYHSHPRSPAIPSRSDIAEAVSDHFLCVIVSLLDPAAPVTRAWQLRGDQAHELRIVSGV